MEKRPPYEQLELKIRQLEKEKKIHSQAKEEFIKRQKYLESVLHNAPDAIITLDSSHCVLDWNPGAEKIFGYSKDEAQGRNLDDLVSRPDVDQEARSNTFQVLSGQTMKPAEYVRYRKDGSAVHVIASGAPIIIDNVLKRVIAVYTDISEKKQAKGINKALFNISNAVNTTKNLNHLFRSIHNSLGTIIDATNFFIAIVDIKKRTIYFPYHVDMVDDDFSPITDFDPDDSLTGMVVLQGKPVLLKKEDLEKRASTDGIWGPEPLIWMGAPLIVKDEIIGVIAVQSYTDPELYNEKDLQILSTVSEQIASAIYRKRAADELQVSEKKYRNIFENSIEGIFQSTPEGRFISVNPAFAQMLGYESAEDLIALITDIETQIYSDPADRHKYDGLLKKKGKAENFEVKFKKKDGSEIWVSLSTHVVYDQNGNIAMYEGFASNIDDRKKLEDQLQQAQKMESIGTLAGGIAHDFNNILFPILGNIEMVLNDIPEDSPIRSRLEKIHKSSLRASDLVKQILTFARQKSGKFILMKMQPVIKETLKLIRSTIPTTIEIKSNIPKECSPVTADPTKIHQIIMNLAANASHAMEETGGQMNVELKEVELGEQDLFNQDIKPGTYACLSVSDTGKGMDKKLIQKIFDPFFTTKQKGKGTGMGLSVVHGIVAGMKGDIKVYSEPGKGTEFHVYLPAAETVEEKQTANDDTPIQGGSEHILLVDDEKPVIDMEQNILKRLGYKVTARFSSLDALEAFRAHPDKFDLVITDMAMPNMAGDRLSAELIKIRPDIPVLLCTGFSETMSEEKAQSLGIKGFLGKPIIVKDFAHTIREVLEQ